MKKLYHVLFVSLLSCVAVSAQDTPPTSAATSKTITIAESRSAKPAKAPAKRGPIFRANKDQVTAAQTILKTKGVYSGDATGKLDPATRISIKAYQKENGLRATGTLNRATLEKMGIELTDKQKAIPVSPNSFATAKTDKPAAGDKPKRTIFRATADQIAEAQKLLKAGGMYAGDETGKLDTATRDGLKKYQAANALKVTGTLNQATLEKMGIALTDKQKGAGDGAN